jgi:hypothetical protein
LQNITPPRKQTTFPPFSWPLTTGIVIIVVIVIIRIAAAAAERRARATVEPKKILQIVRSQRRDHFHFKRAKHVKLTDPRRGCILLLLRRHHQSRGPHHD